MDSIHDASSEDPDDDDRSDAAFKNTSVGGDDAATATVAAAPRIPPPITAGRSIAAAPRVSVALTRVSHDTSLSTRVSAPQLDERPTGPSHAQALEHNIHVDETDFHRQRTLFQATGQARAPESNEIVQRTTLGYDAARLEQLARQEEERAQRKRTWNMAMATTHRSRAEELVVHSDDEATYGVWGPPSAEERYHQDNALSDLQRGVELAPEQLAEREYIAERNRQRGLEQEEAEAHQQLSGYERRVERQMAHLLPSHDAARQPMEATTSFHGSAQVDYKQRSWMAPPPGMGSLLEPSDHKCKVPKKCVAKWTHTDKGVHRIRLFPRSGHLLLSAGLDGSCRIWTVADGQLMRIYRGHSAGVRDVQFNSTGRQFVSASFDRYLRLWDTESGQVLQTFGNNKVPYCVEFYPLDDDYFVVGCSDNKIVAYNTKTAEITQEYNHHLAPVNAILFVTGEEGGVKMVTAADDKKVLVWEWDIGVPIKYISDPTMHSMPCLALRPPDEQFFVGQSLDNTIVVFQANKRFAMQKKKRFSGHIVSGYACQMAFSPDGQFLVSGDGNGNVYLWDWKRHKILQKYKAHSKGPAICCAWHPLEPSTLFTCGWDGLIKVWK